MEANNDRFMHYITWELHPHTTHNRMIFLFGNDFKKLNSFLGTAYIQEVDITIWKVIALPFIMPLLCFICYFFVCIKVRRFYLHNFETPVFI